MRIEFNNRIAFSIEKLSEGKSQFYHYWISVLSARKFIILNSNELEILIFFKS